MKAMFLIFVVNLIFQSWLVYSWEAGDQCLSVKGKIMCRDDPLSDVLVKLMERDNGEILGFDIDEDDLLNSTRTDRYGNFQLQGCHNEIFVIQPFLDIRHRCTYPMWGKYVNRKTKIIIDQDWVQFPFSRGYDETPKEMGILDVTLSPNTTPE